MKMAFILLDGKARTNVLLSTFQEDIVDMDSIVILLSQDKTLLTIEKKLSQELRLLIIYNQDIEGEAYAKSRALVHELNNNLAIIFSSLFITKKLMKKDDVNLEKIESMLTDISATSENMQKIIKGYSAELQGQTVTYEMELNDLVYYIKNTIVPFLLTNRVEYNLDFNILENKKIKLKTTGIHTSQVVINLVKNAAEATIGQDVRVVNVKTFIADDILQIEISDNGPGVPVDHQEEIFKQNFTTKGDKGNGIGLYICKKNIVKSGGSMIYDKSFTDGAKFIVKLPIERVDD